jgi:Ca2+-transporting ATPase
MGITHQQSLHGLTSAQVLEERREHGENLLPTTRAPSALGIFFSQFKNPLVYIILAAAGVSLAMREYSDFAIIMAVVAIDAILGFVQEYQAQRTYSALKGLLKPTATVIRDGTRQEIEVKELVPGDLVVLNAGDRVLGDGQILESIKLTVDEAILTGESEPIAKSTGSEQDQVYTGTTVITGRGLMRVARTGSETELGRIAVSLRDEVQDETPLQVRLKAFSRTLSRLVLCVTAGILVVGLIAGRPFLDMLRVSIILAIAAVPEGLLIAVTVILVLGMRKILKRNGLVKRLLAVETLGSETMVLCNDLQGPVDAALWEYAQAQLPSDPQVLADRAERLDEELFSSDTKFMITANRYDGQVLDYLKGAPEIVLEMCQLDPEERQRVLHQVEEWASEGLRLIGLAYRPQGRLEHRNGYTWLGLVAMEDPIREGVREAINLAQRAGIKVKMLTGDYRRTAERIAAMVGLPLGDGRVMDSEELAQLDNQELAARLERTTVLARIRPQDKLRVVRALQANGEITAMIGDGVNDAPALKRANIGVVVNSATEVAKETADLILLDSNFRTVVAAVEEGRVIFENIRKVVAYTLSNSFAEVLLIFGAMLLNWPAPLMVAQILWIHLICDGPSDIVLGFEPREDGIMEEKPKSPDEPVLNRLGLSLIGIISVSAALVGLYLFGHQFRMHDSAVTGRSFTFASFAVNSMIYIFAYRSLRRSVFHSGPLSQNKPLIGAVLSGLILAVAPFLVPGLRDVLGILPLTMSQWMGVLGVALSLLIVVEVGKWISNKYHRRHRPSVAQASMR